MKKTLAFFWLSVSSHWMQIAGHFYLGIAVWLVCGTAWETLLITPAALLAYLALCKMWQPTEDVEYACFFVLAEDRDRLAALMAADIQEETGLPVKVMSVTKEMADELEEALDDENN